MTDVLENRAIAEEGSRGVPCVHLKGEGARLEVVTKKQWHQVAPVLERHSWSGIVRIAHGTITQEIDLFSWFSYPQPHVFKLDPTSPEAPLTIDVIGQNVASHGLEAVVHGMLAS